MSRARKKECNDLEAARRATLLEVAAGASSSTIVEDERSNTDGAIIAEDSSDGVPTIEETDSGKPKPSAY